MRPLALLLAATVVPAFAAPALDVLLPPNAAAVFGLRTTTLLNLIAEQEGAKDLRQHRRYRQPGFRQNDGMQIDVDDSAEIGAVRPPSVRSTWMQLEYNFQLTERIIHGQHFPKVFYDESCRDYTNIAPNNMVFFTSEKEAKKAGYKKSKSCP